ncbi:hypothetical protein [Kitasatospora sp. HPMI-4]|uniref:hypothetical protein n=1 Tax=Kitasatospora sp. HPMI-4 TaxID=3448443 RepID=UPI003F1DF5E6
MRAAFEEMRRVLCPSGVVLVSFHVGTEIRHLAEWWGHEVDADFRYFETGTVIGWLEEAGLIVEARLERASYPQEVGTRRAYVMARRPG